MNLDLEILLNFFDGIDELDPSGRADFLNRSGWLGTASDDEVNELLDALIQRDPPVADGPEESLLAGVLGILIGRFRSPTTENAPGTAESTRRRLVALYTHLGNSSRARYHLLTLLTTAGNRSELTQFAELIATDPPHDPADAAVPFFPLFDRRDFDPAALFPKILARLDHPVVAAAILDLANYVTREELIAQHPASGRVQQLAALLGGVTGRLGQLEHHPHEVADSADDLHTKVSEGIALTVSLCDALALIGDTSVTGKLYQVLELGHRRLQVEAAAALARLGEEAGSEALVKLASEPVARLRVLSYAEELGCLDAIDQQYRSTVSRAEAELICYLAENTRMGMAPTACELFDRRSLFWPGYDDAIECFLFRYTYQLSQGTYSNIGIAGPLVHCFWSDVGDLAPDDIYAAYAGWQAEHEDIYQVDVDALTERHRDEASRLANRLFTDGYEHVEPLSLGFFFGDRVLIASCACDGVEGTAVVDSADIYWHPSGTKNRPLRPDEAYAIYKGRNLMRTFNP